MPGITSAEIKTETRGSLKTATIQLKAYNKQQFDIIDLLYMRLGFSMLLEWGHSTYYDNNEKFEPSKNNSLASSFLNGQMNYSNYLDKIAKNKLKSNGNYDALVGKVVNFNWTFEKDMSYSITITLRSMGDVIESLKTNILLPSPQNTVLIPRSKTVSITQGISKIVFDKKTFSTEIEKIFYFDMDTLNNIKSDKAVRFNLTSKNNKKTGYDDNRESIIFTKVVYEEGIQYYAKLSYVLWIIENKIIPNVNDDSVKLLTINNRVNSNLIYAINELVSSNYKICNFDNSVNVEGITYYTLPLPTEDKFLKNIKNNIVAQLMNLYVNVDYIVQQLTTLKDKNGKVNIYDFLKSICNGYNTSTGHINSLEPTIDDETGEIRFIDSTPLPNRDEILENLGLSTKTATFNVYKLKENNGSFIRDFNFNTTLTNNLATMITIGATSEGYILGEDATALSRMNKGLKDRFKEKIYNTSVENYSPQSQQGNPNSFIAPAIPPKTFANEEYKAEQEIFKEYLLLISSTNLNKQPLGITANNEIVSSFQNIQSQLYEYIKYKKTSSINPNPLISSPTITGFLPFDLQLTMDGLSGFKIYQKYSINSEFLPSNYPESLEFIIKGISNKISNNEWTTTIESLAIPKSSSSSVDLISLYQTLQVSKVLTNRFLSRNAIFLGNREFSNIRYTPITKFDLININLLNDINQAAKNAGLIVTITTASTGHKPVTSSGNPSRHAIGNAVDIAIIDNIGSNNATSSTTGSPIWREKGNKLKEELVKLGYTWNKETRNIPKSVLWQTNKGGNHFNHLHISIL